MLNLLFQLLAELFITRPPGMEPGAQSPHARRALAELDSRYFRMALPRHRIRTQPVLPQKDPPDWLSLVASFLRRDLERWTAASSNSARRSPVDS